MRHLINFGLLIVAIGLTILLAPLGLLCTGLFCLFRLSWRDALDYLSRLALSTALSIDLLGNVLCADLFNTYLRKENGYAFGRYDQTISAALGYNARQGTLTDLGRLLANLLDWIDPGHLEKAIAAERCG